MPEDDDYETALFLSLNDAEKTMDKTGRCGVRLIREMQPVFERWYKREAEAGVPPPDVFMAVISLSALLASISLDRLLINRSDWDSASREITRSFHDKLIGAGRIINAAKKIGAKDAG